jgi:NADH-quinone oxidoreductase subunit N
MDQQLVQTLQEAAATHFWGAIMPEMLVAFLALGLLILEMLLPREKHRFIPAVAIWGTVAILVWHLAFFFQNGGGHLGSETFAGMLRHDLFGQGMRAFFLLSGAFVCYLGSLTLAKTPVPKTEFYHITLVVTAAMMLLVQSHHFVMLFVALETVTVGFYVLVSYFRHTSVSLEAGLKYLILGALSSSLLLFGIVLLYGVAGNPELAGHTAHAMNFGELRNFLESNSDNYLARIGMVLVLCGVAFKIAAVPFQIWVPDVYQGAPTPVTAFLAVASKAAGFGMLIALVRNVFSPMQDLLLPLLTVMAVLTILLGNLAALTQQNTKRLMGLSGIGHAGYLLVGVAAAVTVDWAAGAVLFYLFTYLLASFAVFGVMIHIGGPTHADQQLEHFTDLGRRSPFLATILVIGLGSLAGIPPLAGFIGKLLLFVAAFEAGLYLLLGVAILGVVVSIYYYFGWMKVAVFRLWRVAPEEAAPAEAALPLLGLGSKLTLGGLAAATVVIGFFQGPLSQWLAAL